MKKKYIQLAVVAVLLGGMAAALFILQKNPPEQEPELATEIIYVTGSAEALPPAQIDIENETGRYTIINTKPDEPEPESVIKGWENFSLDSYGLKGAMSSAKGMTAKRIIVEQASDDDLAAFGLKAPRASVDITGADGEKTIVLIGNDAPGGEGAYVMRKGESTVYLVMPSVAESFIKPDLAYVNSTVTVSDTEYKSFDRVELTGTDYPEPIVIERSPETTVEAAGLTLGTHCITSPINVGLASNTGLEPLSSVYGIIALEVVSVSGDDASELERFGLSEPAADVSVTGEDPEHTFNLRVSKTGDDGMVYLIKSGSPVIYELAADSLPWLGLTLFDYMDKMAVIPHIDSVSKVTVKTPDKNYVFGLSGEDDALAVTLDGSELSGAVKEDGADVSAAQNFRQFYQTLISASYDEETDGAPAENAQPALQIEYAYRNGKTPDTVSFYAGPPRRFFISLNGGTIYLCPSAYVERVLSDAVKVASGEAVKSYF